MKFKPKMFSFLKILTSLHLKNYVYKVVNFVFNYILYQTAQQQSFFYFKNRFLMHQRISI